MKPLNDGERERRCALLLLLTVIATVSCGGGGTPPPAPPPPPPGSLDASFGMNGRVTTPIGGNDYANGVALQRDGKIVVAGGDWFKLARYNPDGTLDAGFGTGGKVATPIGTFHNFASAVAIQGDGKIVAAGTSSNGANFEFALARYHPDGTLDASFGAGGTATTPVGVSDAHATGVVVQGDGKIVVGGYAGYTYAGADPDFALVRYDADGILDTAFGAGGKVTTPVGASSDDVARGIAIQGDGRIVVAGSSSNGTDSNFALVRYNPDATLDTGFGAGGKVVAPAGMSSEFAEAVTIQGDGKIVAAGASSTGTDSDFALARYNPDGTLDAAFGTAGKVITPVGLANDVARGIAIQGDGKIVVAGEAQHPYHIRSSYFALVRYEPDGSLDTGFGAGGKVTTAFDIREADSAGGVAIQADGKILVVGRSSNNTDLDFALARYWP